MSTNRVSPTAWIVTRSLAGFVDAITFIESFDEFKPERPFTRYEVGVRYSNGDEIRGQFTDKANPIAFRRGNAIALRMQLKKSVRHVHSSTLL